MHSFRQREPSSPLSRMVRDGNKITADESTAMAKAPCRSSLTTGDIAARLAVGEDKVRAWINAGELRAINVATVRGRRPRWRIDPEDLEAFIASRSAVVATRPVRRSPRRRDAVDVIRFY